MADLEIRLQCTNCRAYTGFERKAGTQAVACAECGKRHSTDSLFAVEADEEPTFED